MTLTAERPRNFGGPNSRTMPAIGRYPFERLVEEWLRQREEATGATPMAMYGPLQLTNCADIVPLRN